MLEKLKQNIAVFKSYIYQSLSLILPAHYKKTILSRVACLGKDVLNLKYGADNLFLANQQKTRVDVFMDYIDGSKRPRFEIIKLFMERKDILPLIKEQENLPWLKLRRNPDFIVIDSFAELTDKKFTHKDEGWSFCCHLSDLNITPDFEKIFKLEGLLPINEIQGNYNKFFKWVETHYPDIPVYFIHFPTVLDSREEYKERGRAILRIMLEIEKGRQYIKNVFADELMVGPYEGDSFPYHYSKDTNLEFKRLLDLIDTKKDFILK